MRSIGSTMKFIVAVVVIGLMAGAARRAAAKPLKVFILAGQSNMQGHANIKTFEGIGDDPATAPILKEMRDADGKPHVCDKVWISSIGCSGDDTKEQTGKVTAGLGASKDEIGPEFTFGIYTEKLLDEPVLLIKTSWGGKSLHTDFRPPSAGPYVWSDYELSRMNKRGDELEARKAAKIKETGVYYRLMIEHVHKVLGDIKRVVPQYDPKQGYELAGFIWFQGFNDMVSDWTYPGSLKNRRFDLYADLLAHFIRDVRKDLSVPKMPFVIGVLGVDGLNANEGTRLFRQAMAAPAALPEFQGNVIAVQTAPFWDDKLAALQTQVEANWPKVDAKVRAEKNNSWENKMKHMSENFTPEEWKYFQHNGSNGGYHYLGSAKTMALIGKSFAEALGNFPKNQ